jgi:hypothetical protein
MIVKLFSQAFSLHIGASLTADDEAKKIYASVDDILDQADEVDKKLLQVA